MELTKKNLIKYLKENYVPSVDGDGWNTGWDNAIEGIAEEFLTKEEVKEYGFCVEDVA